MRQLRQRRGAIPLYGALLLAAVIAMGLLKTCSASRPERAASLRSGGDTIEVAIEYSPLAMMSQGDTLGGFGYEMLRDIARSSGLKFKFTPVTSLKSSLRAMASGRYDLVVAEVPVTGEFRERYRFTEPVFIDRQVLVQRRAPDGSVSVVSQLDLARRRVRVIAGSPVIDRIRNLSHEIGDTIYIDPDTLYSSEQLFLLVVAGEVPLAVVNSGIARNLEPDYRREIDIVRNISFSQFQSWIMSRRRPAAADSLDSAIVRYRLTPAYRTLIHRYRLTPVP